MIHLEAERDMHIDGKVLAGGSDATYPGMGGGSGGSIYVKAHHLSGLCDTGKCTFFLEATTANNFHTRNVEFLKMSVYSIAV